MSDRVLGTVWVVWREDRFGEFGVLVGIYSDADVARDAIDVMRGHSRAARYQVVEEQVFGAAE